MYNIEEKQLSFVPDEALSVYYLIAMFMYSILTVYNVIVIVYFEIDSFLLTIKVENIHVLCH